MCQTKNGNFLKLIIIIHLNEMEIRKITDLINFFQT